MTPLEESIGGLVSIYVRGEQTQARREELMKCIGLVLDFFILMAK